MRTWIGTTTVALTLAALISVASASDWPRFSGPKDNGISDEKGLIDTFGEDGPEVLWSREMNPGFGGSAIFDGKLYVMDRIGNSNEEGTDVVYCLDLATGKEVWEKRYDAPGRFDHTGTRSTPAVDKDVVITVGPMGDVRCWDREKQTLLWQADLLADWNDGKKAGRPTWAVAQSALIVGDKVFLAPQNGKVGVVAYEKKTGKIIWESKPIGSMAYASPRKVTLGGVEQIMMHTNDRTVGIDIKDGSVLWTYDGWKCRIPVATPTDLGDGRFFITGAYKAGCAMIQVKKDGDKWTVEQLYSDQGTGDAKPNIHSWMQDVIYFEGHLYVNSSTSGQGLACLTPEGKVLWASQQQFDSGGPLLIADGKVFIVHGQSGELFIAKASPEGYKELAKAKVLEGKGAQVWAPLSLSDGKLIVRDKYTLKCLNVKAKQMLSAR
ncbi:MAG: PQQ-like beta-propeller repeat protein [Phycisphaerae bacterium]|nr:PQQ-like beta-propeller repeat protein [Phycisphaerae bacterium]